MASVAYTPSVVQSLYGHVHTVAWGPLTSSNVDGVPLEMPGAADRSVQIEGTPGGATTVIQGSNDGVNYHTLTDPQGVALSFTSTAAVLKQISEITRYIKPSTSGGDGTQSLTVTLVLRSTL